MTVDTLIQARDLRAGMTVRTPADFKYPAGEWLTVEQALKYSSGGGFVMKVRFTNGLAHDPRVEDLYEMKP